jgi:hypothetical protein
MRYRLTVVRTTTVGLLYWPEVTKCARSGSRRNKERTPPPENAIFILLWSLSGALAATCAPTCRPTDCSTGRTHPGHQVGERGGPGYLNACVLFLVWNATTCTVVAVLTPARFGTYVGGHGTTDSRESADSLP